MAAQKGKEILIKTDISGTQTLIGGMQAKSMKINNGTTEVSATDSPDTWRELLEGANTQSLSITGSGVLKNTAGQAEVVTASMANTPLDMEFVVPGLGTFACAKMMVSGLDINGGNTGEAKFSGTFESGATVTFAAA